MTYQFQPIGLIHSPYKEKFGVPRQSGLVAEAEATLELLPGYDSPEAFIGLDEYSHLWIQFVFSENVGAGWQPRVRPPRLGGNRRVGVFASRSPFRPNPIGLSVVELRHIKVENERVTLALSGIDMVDGTPVLDIKPYVAYADSYPDARSGFAPTAPECCFEVIFSERAKAVLAEREDAEQLRTLIVRLLETDPRPAYMSDNSGEREYGFQLYDFDLRWMVKGEQIVVVDLAAVGSGSF
ncbi:MAG: tRNA (N6-threonylcarbamoyladenosine(37)-N6)-methyltransferase TrmO [Chromatiales bacterium]|nr:tRNA (N6-threonylcarbamoyladenosine(37)-N6)-methyltransferase TrmO [Chromatiales bacterium]